MIQILFLFVVAIGLIFPQTAVSGGEGSSAGIQKAFAQMTPIEAFNSNLFEKKILNRQFPGTSTWMNPATNFCINADRVQTVRPRRVCKVWSVDLKEAEFGSRVSTHTSYREALEKSKSSNGRSEPYCPEDLALYEIYSAPLSSMSPYFVVEFYEKVVGKNRFDARYFLGDYVYQIPDCGHYEILSPDVVIRLTGGEGSGGGAKKKSL